MEPSRRSSRVSHIVEEKKSRLAGTAQKTNAAEGTRGQKAAPPLPKSQRGNVRGKKNDPVDTLERTTTQAPKKRTSKKPLKAAAVTVPESEAKTKPRKVRPSA